ncbi:MAG: aminotransferase class I/II-fold pyridoxal phosphate-dependent enzyme [Saccharothrix sp.]|nr:aminotransferase class I/II-fold pyridoxal phosphate-dependent enzyme [Saccharothrix sp.]
MWGFAKDFGLSGLRTGFLVSRWPGVARLMHGDPPARRTSQAWFSPYDSLKHRYTTAILDAEGSGFWDRAMTAYRQRLTDSFTAVAKVLDHHRVPYVHPLGGNSAQFFWLDLRQYLNGPFTEEPDVLFTGTGAEAALAQAILKHTGVKLLTGTTLSCPREGYYRLCFTAADRRTVVDAVDRMCHYLNRADH